MHGRPCLRDPPLVPPRSRPASGSRAGDTGRSPRRGGAWGAAVAVVLAIGAAGGYALLRRVGAPDADLEAGRADFARYCAECHGEDARGSGPLAARLTTPPADLTRIAARHGGIFHADDLVRWIDGRKLSAAHADRDMPIWGRILDGDVGSAPPGADPEAARRARFQDIVLYLWSVQR
jgi:mono/diheme cytochrome c family protein